MQSFSLTVRRWLRFAVFLVAITLCWSLATPAQAALDNDQFDGNIFVLYAGNGSLVPPRINLAESLKAKKPALLVFYLDDSKDCKRYAGVVSQLQSYYGRAANFIPVSVDSLNSPKYLKTEAGFYYSGTVPQTVLIDDNGKVVFNQSGNSSFEDIDDSLRQVFHRPARAAAPKLEQRSFNEFNSELVK